MQNILNEILKGYKIKASCLDFETKNHFNIYHIKLAHGCKIRALENIATEIQLSLKLTSTPTFVPDPESGMVKMISTKEPDIINFSDILDKDRKNIFDVSVGIDSYGNILKIDFDKVPHLLVAGATGSGKSVFLHTLIANLLLNNHGEQIMLYLIDPKVVEFEGYKKLSLVKGHIHVRNTYEEAIKVLNTLSNVMEKRFKLLSKFGCKSVFEFNKKHKSRFTRIICIIDELADLVLRDKGKRGKSEFELLVCTLAAKARAAGIHLILSTQRPSIDVITGLIKANFPIRVCFRVSSNTDSRVVLDYKGGENLIGKGDGILSGYYQSPIRFQTAYTDFTSLCRMLKK